MATRIVADGASLEPAVRPVINRKLCENKAACAAVCPYGVFVIRELDAADKRALGKLDRFKIWVHGNKQAYADFADRCQGCGACLTACPESAISLKRL